MKAAGCIRRIQGSHWRGRVFQTGSLTYLDPLRKLHFVHGIRLFHSQVSTVFQPFQFLLSCVSLFQTFLVRPAISWNCFAIA